MKSDGKGTAAAAIIFDACAVSILTIHIQQADDQPRKPEVPNERDIVEHGTELARRVTKSPPRANNRVNRNDGLHEQTSARPATALACPLWCRAQFNAVSPCFAPRSRHRPRYNNKFQQRHLILLKFHSPNSMSGGHAVIRSNPA